MKNDKGLPSEPCAILASLLLWNNRVSTIPQAALNENKTKHHIGVPKKRNCPHEIQRGKKHKAKQNKYASNEETKINESS